MEIAIKLLSDGFLESKDEASSKDAELKHIKAEMAKLQLDYEKAISNSERYSRDICQLREKHEQELKDKQKELEEQVLTLMTQAPYCDSPVSERFISEQNEVEERLKAEERLKSSYDEKVAAQVKAKKEMEKELIQAKNEAAKVPKLQEANRKIQERLKEKEIILKEISNDKSRLQTELALNYESEMGVFLEELERMKEEQATTLMEMEDVQITITEKEEKEQVMMKDMSCLKEE
ncbi:hypothetical protein QYM36_005343 [Artemia franciscana]|uniref:Uncharacterized protein n=1 Tax=Artemia franciscana TaxID=6661 RepID=A0AA88I7N2_ARTSF|nr:hypothetical protein QYM36_005343 [Artemia franciscana]